VPIRAAGITPVFQCTGNNAESFARELSEKYGRRILYPASSLAADTLQAGLKARGFEVWHNCPFLHSDSSRIFEFPVGHQNRFLWNDEQSSFTT
jgi:hypothetical protein